MATGKEQSLGKTSSFFAPSSGKGSAPAAAQNTPTEAQPNKAAEAGGAFKVHTATAAPPKTSPAKPASMAAKGKGGGGGVKGSLAQAWSKAPAPKKVREAEAVKCMGRGCMKGYPSCISLEQGTFSGRTCAAQSALILSWRGAHRCDIVMQSL
ncbi:hypothetical protein DUNSADRAFT_9333 [Dunaliella salina]|uniref:Uncharacterized protein n=1 Tax=Dunaliella salina TaxID=3046 RepID=A0ABQ7H5E1_DUNSA|nr:hypothetical protein DUNSADRAFT_9333 [Dunaliella salina]|eukprot:KAF5842074.1 hypothetical protein DUNSADRAFT_9333 [Dunaliella salina]